jgi:plasmid stabilization system protein ParE
VVNWSLRARADLKAIHAFIAKDSPTNALAIVREITERANRIDQTPHIGRTVPELCDATLREIPAVSWRVLYQLRDEQVFIVTLIHKRSSPTPEMLRPQ